MPHHGIQKTLAQTIWMTPQQLRQFVAGQPTLLAELQNNLFHVFWLQSFLSSGRCDNIQKDAGMFGVTGLMFGVILVG